MKDAVNFFLYALRIFTGWFFLYEGIIALDALANVKQRSRPWRG